MDDAESVVFHNGSFRCQVGFERGSAPHDIFPSVVGYPKSKSYISALPSFMIKQHYVGDDAHCKRALLSLNHPIEQGIITNWDDIEKLWHHAFYDLLRVAPEETPVLMTEAPFNPKYNREKMIQTVFETFHVPSFYVAVSSVLSLYSANRVTGCVVDSGHDVTHVVPIYEGHALRHTSLRLDVAGRQLTDYLAKLLNAQQQQSLSSSSSSSISSLVTEEDVRDMKEKLCYVALDFDEEVRQGASNKSAYELPDGQIFEVADSRFRVECTEPLFQPGALLGLECGGIHETTFNAIMKSDIEIRRELANNIVLAGGTTMFPGLARRMEKELGTLLPAATQVRVLDRPERKYSAWVGGCVLSSLSVFRKAWISKADYNEIGPHIVHSMCW
ncbi:actin [Balamuthia mandrillaris]